MMRKRKVSPDVALSTSKRGVPDPESSHLCFAHKNAIPSEAIIHVKLFVQNADKRDVSFSIPLCKNTPCFLCESIFKDGDSIAPCITMPHKFYHHDCNTTLQKNVLPQYRCECHDHAILECNSTEVLCPADMAVRVCVDLKCPNCGDGFTHHEKVETISDSVYHGQCTRACYVKDCRRRIPATDTEIGCAYHAIKCLLCERACTPVKSRVPMYSGASRNSIVWVCIRCNKHKKRQLREKHMEKANQVTCSDGIACLAQHSNIVQRIMDTGISAVCSEAVCIGCGRKACDLFGVLHASDGNLVCFNCSMNCSICKCVLVPKRYSGPGPFSAFNRDWNCCASHAVMRCETCCLPISVDMDTGKHYKDVSKWLHHACYSTMTAFLKNKK